MNIAKGLLIMKEEVITCKIKTSNGLIVKCELTLNTIKKLKQQYCVTIYKSK